MRSEREGVSIGSARGQEEMQRGEDEEPRYAGNIASMDVRMEVRDNAGDQREGVTTSSSLKGCLLARCVQ